MPRYCYFPFNLKNKTQIRYLSTLATTGTIRLAFLAGTRASLRSYKLTAAEHGELRKVLPEALDVLNTFEGTHKFARVVEEFETTIRLPHFFERTVSDSEFARAVELQKANAEKVPAEKRALAHQIVRGIANPVRNRWSDQLQKIIGELAAARIRLSLLFDVIRMFGDDYDGFVNFFADGVALSTEDAALTKLADWPSKLEPVLKLIDR